MSPPASRVAAFRLVGTLRARFVRDWRLLPADARARWLKTTALGALACAALVGLLTWGGQRLERGGHLTWERSALERLERVEAFSFQAAHVLETLGGSTVVVPAVALAAGLAVALGAPLRALSLPLGLLGSKALVALGWALWGRDRPDFIADGLAVPASLNAYPSGHTAQTLVVYGLLAWFWASASQSRLERAAAWGLLALLLALVGAARLRIGAHWPSDIAAGALVGAAWLATLVVALRRAGDARA
ncbi:MAG TPA: phosphatase PAP2 family protein [Polyangiaceae bacterium]|nr:phosphatase PAP2 family protein [Polyangiaceae bacterium]